MLREDCPLLTWSICVFWMYNQSQLTFQVEQHVGLVVFEHLSDQFDIHIVNIDFLLEVLVENQAWKPRMSNSLADSCSTS